MPTMVVMQKKMFFPYAANLQRNNFEKPDE
jgi:hypothetical protein